MYSHILSPVKLDKDIINSVNKYNVSGGWEKNNKEVKYFKKTIRSKMLIAQNYRCAYCELHIEERGPEIEHIAYKSRYPEVSFLPLNLVMACHRCNSNEHKGYRNVVTNNEGEYTDWKFSIVHPYFDDPLDYFDYIEEFCLVSIKKDISDEYRQKAERTIDLFDLNRSSMIEERFREREYDKIKDDVKIILEKISTINWRR